MVQYTASQTSLVKSPSSMAEMYIPLWVFSSGISGGTTNQSTTSLIGKGDISLTSYTATSRKLHTLSSGWGVDQKFALEVSIKTNNNLGVVSAGLFDITAAATVSGSSVSSTSQTYIVIRSGVFSLVAGHTYGVYVVTNNASYVSYFSKAHLVALL